MGDYTVREVLRRRSAETLRKIQQRRDQHKKPTEGSSGTVWFILFLLVFGPPLGYAWWVGSSALEQPLGAGPRNSQVYLRALELAPGMVLEPLALRGSSSPPIRTIATSSAT